MNLIHTTFGQPLWFVASRFIGATYSLHYNARVTHLPKNIIALVDRQNKAHCAAGLRDFSEPYFSEYYLDDHIEAVISVISGKPVKRYEIVEVSCLASRTPAASLHFIRDLIFYSEELAFNWAFFTATSRLEKMLRRMRLPLINLGVASSNRVPSPEAWGSYYQTNPQVLAVGREHMEPFLMKRPEAITAPSIHAHG
jgi:Thermostable hemolysin